MRRVLVSRIAIVYVTSALVLPSNAQTPSQNYHVNYTQSTFDEHIVLKKETVAILTGGTGGTGVIVGKKGNVYTALTAAHVLANYGRGDELQVESLMSGKKYNIDRHYRPKPTIDISVIQFTSRENFNIAPIAAFYSVQDDHHFKNQITEEWNTTRFYGIVYGASAPTNSIKMRVSRLERFDLRTRVHGNELGLEFIYSASTVPGMSGSPIFVDQEWTCSKTTMKLSGPIVLAAIHARSEEYPGLQSRSGISLAAPVDLIKLHLKSNAISLGVPTSAEEIKELVNKQFCPPAEGIGFR